MPILGILLCFHFLRPAYSATIKVADDVSFFLRASPATRQLVFSTLKGNRVLKLGTKKIRELPGEIDPALSPDGRLLAVPETWIYDPVQKKMLSERDAAKLGYRDDPKKRVRFTLDAGAVFEWAEPPKGEKTKTAHTEETLRAAGLAYSAQYMSFYRPEGARWLLLLQDKEMQVAYQSLGQLKTKKGEPVTYRLLVQGEGGLDARDYTLDASGLKLVPSGPVKKICPGFVGTLPMISKNAEELVTFDAPAETTKVVRIGAKGDACEITDTLPYHAGKADFSPSGSLLAFHLFDKVLDRLRPYIYDRVLKKLSPLSSPAKEDAYFPTFLSEHEVAYLSAKRIGDKREFSVRTLRLKKVETKEKSDKI